MILIKLGGSVITDKSTDYTFKADVVERLTDEIRSVLDGDYIIIHGGGSYGHPGASRYGLNTSAPKKPAKGMAEVQYHMRELNQLVLKIMLDAGIAAISLPGGLLCAYKDGDLYEIDSEIIFSLVDMGAVPVAFGDVVLDSVRGVSICSGDDLMMALAPYADKAVFVTDVDGIFKEGKLCTTFTSDMLPLDSTDTPGSKERIDVTGGMDGKARKMLEMSNICPSYLVNGNVAGRLKDFLNGNKTVSTEVKV